MHTIPKTKCINSYPYKENTIRDHHHATTSARRCVVTPPACSSAGEILSSHVTSPLLADGGSQLTFSVSYLTEIPLCLSLSHCSVCVFLFICFLVWKFMIEMMWSFSQLNL